jgi:hypothetical protein
MNCSLSLELEYSRRLRPIFRHAENTRHRLELVVSWALVIIWLTRLHTYG